MTTPQTPASPAEPLSPEDFDELDALLDDLRSREEEIPQWEMCEGFMAALVCCRRKIEPAEYLPVLLGTNPEDEGTPALFADDAQFARFMALWSRRWAEVAQALDAPVEALDDERAYQPEVMDLRGAIASLPPEVRAEMDDTPIPSFGQIWAIGFMYAVESWPDEWTPPRERAAAELLDQAIASIVTLAEDDPGPMTIGPYEDAAEPTMSEQRLNDFADALWAVYDLRMLWRELGPRVKTVHKLAVPGRNDLCSCGSGKKYKKCCGANAA